MSEHFVMTILIEITLYYFLSSIKRCEGGFVVQILWNDRAMFSSTKNIPGDEMSVKNPFKVLRK